MLHRLVSPGGKVVGIDHISQLVDWSIGNLKKDGLGHALETGEVVIVSGDGRLGYAQEGVCVCDVYFFFLHDINDTVEALTMLSMLVLQLRRYLLLSSSN